jgi:hypothetical protein
MLKHEREPENLPMLLVKFSVNPMYNFVSVPNSSSYHI